jgi:uncharacterized membrane protein
MHLALLVIIIIILFIILTRINTRLSDKEILKKSIEDLKDEIVQLNKKVSLLQFQHEPREEKKSIVEKQEAVVPVPVVKVPEKSEVDKTSKPEIKEIQKEPIKEKIIIEESRPSVPSYPVDYPKENWFEKWLQNNPDIEKFIGENLINKIGIGVLILGIAFFVKYAIDENWINEVGRVSIGLLCGVILIALAHRVRKNYRSFSSVLVGGGLTVFYFTIAFAFHQYHLLNQSSAFIIMTIITVFAVILSILYNRIELAILATIGGFITPFLVSTGQTNYVALFTYLNILNGGLIALAFHKRWNILNFIAFIFTVIIYGGWIVSNNDNRIFPYEGTFLFGTIFYVMFVTMNIIQYTIKSIKLNAFDFASLLVTNCAYYAAGIYLLQNWGMTEYKGLFTASLGLLNLILAFVFFKRKHIDKNFTYLLIGLTLSFISLAAPVQLKGNYITIFWSAETVLLFWLYQKSFIRLLKIATAIITILSLLSLFMDWSQVYVTHFILIPVIINKGLITTIFCASAAVTMVYLLKREADTYYLGELTNATVRLFYFIVSIALFFIGCALEINYQFSNRFKGIGLEYIYLQLFITGFFLSLFFIFQILKIKVDNYVRLGIPFVLFVFYLFNISNSYNTEELLLSTTNLQAHFLAHWISIIFLIFLIAKTILYVKTHQNNFKNILNVFSWITVSAIIILLSLEIMHLYLWLIYQNQASIGYAENLYNKAGLSIVWGISSFILIWLGMHYRFKSLRVIALVLFGITLIKLFVFDLKNIPPGGKIVAFILLGILLLIVSFMYQRLKKLIIDDSTKK